MQVERFNYKEFHNEAIVLSSKGMKLFKPIHAKEEAPPPPPPPPSFSMDEMKTAEREGYQKGFLDGMQEGRNQAESEQAAVDRALEGTVEKFVESIAPLLADYRAFALQMQDALPQMGLAIARKVAGEALDEHAAQRVEAIALRWVETMIHEPKLTVTVHESLRSTLEQKLKALAARLQSAGDIVVIGDSAMPLADCRIDWKHGGVQHQTDQLWQQVETAAASIAEMNKRESLAQLDALEATLLPDTQQPAEQPTPEKE